MKKQEVRSFGIISLFSLMGVCVFVLSPTWKRSSSSQQDFTMRRAESLAYQVLESQKSASRRPASVMENHLNHLLAEAGQIGVDPWGRPFQFRVFKTTPEAPGRIFVWSPGPDGQVQTTEDQIASNRDNPLPDFVGDDIGIMVQIN